jgi:hypothetical protein
MYLCRSDEPEPKIRMLISKFSIEPGDLIEWVVEATDRPVSVDERLWSTSLHRYVPIGSNLIHLLITIDNEHVFWFNSKGLFHAYVDDVFGARGAGTLSSVIPHTCLRSYEFEPRI